MQDRTINNALMALRREGGEAQRLAERPLILRGVDHFPRMVMHPAKRGQAQRIALSALSDGPKTIRQVASYMGKARPELTSEAAYKRAGIALAKLKAKGRIERDGGLWKLAPQGQS